VAGQHNQLGLREPRHHAPPYLRIKSAPTFHATLSRWANESRRAAGLNGGYRAAIDELLPEAQRQVDIARGLDHGQARAGSA